MLAKSDRRIDVWTNPSTTKVDDSDGFDGATIASNAPKRRRRRRRSVG